MNRAEYEQYLKSKNLAATAACDKHYPDIVECLREDFGYRCPKCSELYKYEKLNLDICKKIE